VDVNIRGWVSYTAASISVADMDCPLPFDLFTDEILFSYDFVISQGNRTCVYWAASDDDIKLLKLLIEEFHANMEVKNWYNKTALFSGRHQFRTLKYLVEAGADIGVLTDLKMDSREYKFVADFLAQCKLMFLFGFHKRVGVNSSVNLYLNRSGIFDTNLLSCIFEFVD